MFREALITTISSVDVVMPAEVVLFAPKMAKPRVPSKAPNERTVPEVPTVIPQTTPAEPDPVRAPIITPITIPSPVEVPSSPVRVPVPALR